MHVQCLTQHCLWLFSSQSAAAAAAVAADVQIGAKLIATGFKVGARACSIPTGCKPAAVGVLASWQICICPDMYDAA